MPKTASPGTIAIPGIGEFDANAVPDPFDERDLIYRPKLEVRRATSTSAIGATSTTRSASRARDTPSRR